MITARITDNKDVCACVISLKGDLEQRGKKDKDENPGLGLELGLRLVAAWSRRS